MVPPPMAPCCQATRPGRGGAACSSSGAAPTKSLHGPPDSPTHAATDLTSHAHAPQLARTSCPQLAWLAQLGHPLPRRPHHVRPPPTARHHCRVAGVIGSHPRGGGGAAQARHPPVAPRHSPQRHWRWGVEVPHLIQEGLDARPDAAVTAGASRLGGTQRGTGCSHCRRRVRGGGGRPSGGGGGKGGGRFRAGGGDGAAGTSGSHRPWWQRQWLC